MKILIVTDKVGSAIHRMSMGLVPYLNHWNPIVVDVHPKRPSEAQLAKFYNEAKSADLIDFQYWKTAEMLLGMYPEFKQKKKILTHHNPYDLFQNDWSGYDKVIVLNKTQQRNLPQSKLIEHSIDLDFFKFNPDYTEGTNVLMVAARIEGKKGILPVAQACKELGYPFILVGSISKAEYFAEIQEMGVDFRPNISNQELRELYGVAAVHVCNSIDDYESGTLPILESMATGVPVLTRKIGLVPDIYNKLNMVVREGEVEDVEDIKKHLKDLMDNREKRLEMRRAALKTIRYRGDKLRARKYSKLYWQIIRPEPVVSVIIPVHNEMSQLAMLLGAYANQSYKALEVIVCDDNSEEPVKGFIDKIRSSFPFPIKYIQTSYSGYGLAKARNMGAIVAEGKYLLFNDIRLVPDKDLVNEFVYNLDLKDEKIWYFGNKGYEKTTFVENLSFILREKFIGGGMCCEQIDQYGGMSQELRTRFTKQGFKFRYMPNAKAEAQSKGSGERKYEDIRHMKELLYYMYES